MARWFVKEDKNGTKIYHDDTCQRCGGHGALEQWRFTGCTCYECGGSGRSKIREYKEYTPEYQAKLDAQRAKRQAKAEAERVATIMANLEKDNAEFMQKHFNGSDTIYIIKGETFPIKDTLKAEGCKFDKVIGWYSTEPTSREAWTVPVADLITTNMYGGYLMKIAFDLLPIIKAVKASDLKKSEYQGNVGDKLTVEVTVSHVAWFEARSFSGYGTTTTYINNMVDANGNVYIWKTTSSMEKGAKVTVTGTVKEHSEYNEVKQTVLTRCKVK